MRKVVASLRAGKARGTVDVLFSDGSTRTIPRKLVDRAGIHPGAEIDAAALDKIIADDDAERCYEAALKYLEFRVRSEAETRQHLRYRKGFRQESVSAAVAKLKSLKLLDDRAFAEAWTRDRLHYRPKSRLMIKKELLQKGIDYAIASEATGGIEDETGAYKAGLKKARLIKDLEYADFMKRLSAYLARRGYAVDAVNSVCIRLWHETTGKKGKK